MGFVSNLRFVPQKAVVKNDSSFSVTMNFENVVGAPQAVDAINAAVETVQCPSGFNGIQLALTTANLASTIYSAIKSAKTNK